ncbi:MAG: PEP-CTERM sorting domain-containing protein [Synechocystis sp.]|nr:PEP-CTERM sorting domain-containing protein [Synechocystis sp.]
MKRHSLFAFVTPVFALSSIVITLPSNAANFSSLSEVGLTISDFSVFPTKVKTFADVDGVAIADQGEIDVLVEGDAIFVSDQETGIAFGDEFFATSIVGKGTDYLGEAYVISKLLGTFYIPADTPFSFGIATDAYLANQTSNLTSAPLSTSATIKLTLHDVWQGEKYNLIDFYGRLGTTDISPFNQDTLDLNTSPYLNVTGSQLGTQFGGKNESLFFGLNADYQFTFDQDTKLLLTGTITSCSFASNTPGACANVPEPSTKLGLIAGILFFFSIRMKKQIGEFSRQPFTKHFFQNFLLNIRG